MNRIINAAAPIRICDIGGWTDTWFAVHGNILNFAVYPYIEVQLRITEKKGEDRVVINLENYGDTYSINPDNLIYDKHPLIESAIDIMRIPDYLAFHVNIYSPVPPGASTGTSAAVSIALIGALDNLTGGRLTPYEVAAMAHRVETEKLGLQSGIQDQLCSAYGGISYIKMFSYPHGSVSSINLNNSFWWELEKRLGLVYIGTPHSSSEVHQRVIRDLESNAENDYRINGLRQLAADAKDALYDENLGKFGEIMNKNTQLQRELHKDLVCGAFEEIINIAEHYDVTGCKVNGAGGDGGSITLLTDGDMAKKRKLYSELRAKGYDTLPVFLSRFGLRVWKGTA